jgi:hypothetical protein
MTDNTTIAYRTCFSTNYGKLVLGNILIDAGYFDTELKTSEQIAVENFAKGILKKVLGGDPDKTPMCEPSLVGGFVDKLFELPVENKNEEVQP